MEKDVEQEINPDIPNLNGAPSKAVKETYQPELSYNALSGASSVTILSFKGSLRANQFKY